MPPLIANTITGGREEVKWVSQYRYLGVDLTNDLDLKAFFERRMSTFKAVVTRFFGGNSIIRSLPWPAQMQIASTMCIGQHNYMLAVLDGPKAIHDKLDGQVLRIARNIFRLPKRMTPAVAEMEAPGWPMTSVTQMHQIRFWQTLQYAWQQDGPAASLVQFQLGGDKEWTKDYASKMRKMVKDYTDSTRRQLAFLPPHRDAREARQSAKAFSITLARYLSGLSTSAADRGRERAHITLALTPPPVPANAHVGALYMVGCGLTGPECFTEGVRPSLATVGPRTPSLASAFPSDPPPNWFMLARSGREAFLGPPWFKTPKGYKLKGNAYARFKSKGECPLCQGEDAEDGPQHLACLCTNTAIREEQTKMRASARLLLSTLREVIAKVAKENAESSAGRSRVEAGRRDVEAQEGRIVEANTDSNNVIFRLLTAVPFHAGLGKADATKRGPSALPLTTALGGLFQATTGSRGDLAPVAAAIITWANRWWARLANVRKKELPEDYYTELIMKKEKKRNT